MFSNMRTNIASFYLTRSKLRTDLLALFFLNPEASYYLRELERRLKVSPGALARELKNLFTEGILLKEPRGREVFYRINRGHPLFKEIKGIIEKTSGIPAALSRELCRIKEIKEAYLYGSVVTGKMEAASDIDLLLIGKETESSRKLLEALQRKFGRMINAVTYSPAEFDKKRRDKSEFLHAIMKSPLLKLKPDSHGNN